MNLVKAVTAFIRVLCGGGECDHPRVNLIEAPSYCPDCGYRIKIEWLFVHCRGCNARRVPQRTFLGGIRPLHQYCRHCGYDGFKIMRKAFIEAYELMYALSVKAVEYEQADPHTPANPARNPFYKTSVTVESGDVFEAEVIRKTEYRGTRSAFKQAPFGWQTRQEPKRYGASTGPAANIIPLRQSG